MRDATAIQKSDIPQYAPAEIDLPNGWRAEIKTEYDDAMGEPWKEHDGHGVISEWRSKDIDPSPSERVLCEDRGSARYYDVAATLILARKDGWGCGIDAHKHRRVAKTADNPWGISRAAIACAVERDYERMRGWCRDDWQWIGVIATVYDADGEKVSDESLWGIESDGDYWREVAAELVNQQIVGVLIPAHEESSAAHRI
jgi:hypothetical protein